MHTRGVGYIVDMRGVDGYDICEAQACNARSFDAPTQVRFKTLFEKTASPVTVAQPAICLRM